MLSQQIPSKLICYGSLPNHDQRTKRLEQLQVFAGRNCLLKFLLWVLNNLVDYKVEKRNDWKQLSIFTIGGCEKELPWLLRSLV